MSKFLFRLWLFFFLFSFFFLTTSCAMFDMGYERCYTGEYKSLSDVSLVVTLSESMAPSRSSWIDTIDNQQTMKSVKGGITFPSVRELNPGTHNICTTFQIVTGSSITSSPECRDIILDTKPGHVYLIYPRVRTHDRTWDPDYWDLTGELHTSEMKDLVSEIDRTLAKYRVNGSSISVLTLATKESDSPLIGFGEEHKSSLKKWLNKNITVKYNYNRYIPYIVAEADDGFEYHLEIDQKTGLVANVLGKTVEPKFMVPAFQPLNSKIAYQSLFGGREIKKWEEQNDGSYIEVE